MQRGTFLERIIDRFPEPAGENDPLHHLIGMDAELETSMLLPVELLIERELLVQLVEENLRLIRETRRALTMQETPHMRRALDSAERQRIDLLDTLRSAPAGPQLWAAYPVNVEEERRIQAYLDRAQGPDDILDLGDDEDRLPWE